MPQVVYIMNTHRHMCYTLLLHILYTGVVYLIQQNCITYTIFLDILSTLHVSV